MDGIDCTRRDFVGRAAMTIAAAQFGVFGAEVEAREPRELAAIARAGEWLNSPPLTPSSLAGKSCSSTSGPTPASIGCVGTRKRRYVRTGRAGDEVLGQRRAEVLLAHHAREVQHRAAWPVVHHEVLGLPGGVARDGNHHAGGLAFDLAGVLFDKAVVAVVAGEMEFLVLIRVRASSTSVRTASAPCRMPCIAAPSPATSSARRARRPFRDQNGSRDAPEKLRPATQKRAAVAYGHPRSLSRASRSHAT
jgi:hypothetical protein